jgi:6-phosphogluconolactonase
MILGIGDDGHTASIFPGNTDLFAANSYCAVTSHPVTKQSRLTLTGKVINNSEAAVFIATGRAKSGIIASIIKETPESRDYPASFVRPQYGSLDWFVDEDAAFLL